MAIRVHRAFPSVRLSPPPQISWPALTMTGGIPSKMIALWMVVQRAGRRHCWRAGIP